MTDEASETAAALDAACERKTAAMEMIDRIIQESGIPWSSRDDESSDTGEAPAQRERGETAMEVLTPAKAELIARMLDLLGPFAAEMGERFCPSMDSGDKANALTALRGDEMQRDLREYAARARRVLSDTREGDANDGE